jgi:hypothetical protein
MGKCERGENCDAAAKERSRARKIEKEREESGEERKAKETI